MKREYSLVGFPVHYYLGGDKQNEPQAAMVVRDWKTGVFSLSVFPINGGDQMFKKSVRVVGDPWFQTYPQSLVNDGAWDYIPGMSYPQEKEWVEFKVAVDDVPSGNQRRIRELHADGYTEEQIFRKLSHKGVNKATIAAVLGGEKVTV